VTYTPDSSGRDLSAVDNANGINYATSATYDATSALTGFVSGYTGSFAGITNSFTFNKRLQPVSMSASVPSQTVFSIGYDFHVGNGTAGSGSDNGNVYVLTNNKDNTRSQAFTYDATNRLISAQNAGTDCTQTLGGGHTKFWGNSYAYDAWGNLLAKTVTKCSAENLNVTALTNNRLSGYGYDAAGNMTSDPTDQVTATYDPENRFATATKLGVTTSYTYDADGNRVEKSNGSAGTLYWYMSPGIVAESDLAGNLQSEYVFFDGERIARKDFPSNAVSYYFSDHLKTTDIITDAQGNIKNESDYYPWGGELSFVANDSNHYKFTGKERDSETQLDYFGARYYSNGLGRWISADWSAAPIPVPYSDFSDPQTLNLYGYLRGLPTTKVDVDGHDCGPVNAGANPCSLKDIGQQLIGYAKGLASAVYHLGASSDPVSMAMDRLRGEPKLLQPANDMQALGKFKGVISGTAATMLVVPESTETTVPRAVEAYDVGTYGELTSRSVVGDGLTIDHIPSNASNIARAEAAKGEALTQAERAAVREQGMAVAHPESVHRSASPTFGGRNTPAQIAADAANPQAAAARDTQAMVNAASAADKVKAQAAAAKLCQAAAQCK
jgi:RHS repeat-associated protein